MMMDLPSKAARLLTLETNSTVRMNPMMIHAQFRSKCLNLRMWQVDSHKENQKLNTILARLELKSKVKKWITNHLILQWMSMTVKK